MNLPPIFKNKNFLLLWFSQILSVLTVHLINFSLVIRIFDLTSSSLLVSVLVFAIIFPSIFFSVIGGALADRWNRKNILIVTNLIQAFTTLLYLGVFANSSGILLVAFLNSLIAQFYIPTEAATLPTLVKNEELTSANALFAITLYGGFFVGYALAGPLLIFFGNNSPFYLGSLMLFAAFVVVLFLPADSKHKGLSLNIKKAFWEILDDIKEAVSYIKANINIYSPVLRFIGAVVLLYIILVLFPPFAKRDLGIDIKDLSHAMIAPVGIGIVLGSFFIEKFKNKLAEDLWVNLGYLVSGLSMILLVVYSGFRFLDVNLPIGGRIVSFPPLVGILSIMLGIGSAFVMIITVTQIQENTHGRILGRVYSMALTLANLFVLPLVFIAGGLADLIPAKYVILVLSVLIIVLAIRGLFDKKTRIMNLSG